MKEGIPKYFPTHTRDAKPNSNQDSSQDRSQDRSQDKPPGNKMDKLTDKAADLSISAADSAKLQRSRSQVLQAEGEEQVRRSPRIRAKRVRSALDEAC